MNTLIVYRLSDGRVMHYAQQDYGLPAITDWDAGNFDSTTPLFDTSSMDYQVGVLNYDEDDWDATTGLLTDAACTIYGIETGAKSKYIKDLEIVVPELDETAQYADDLVATVTGGEIASISKATPLTAADRQSTLAITFGEVAGGGISDQGADPINGMLLWSAVTDTATDRLEITVRKLDADGDPMTAASDDDEVVLRVSGGKIFGDYIKNLVNGVITFEWQPPVGSGIATAAVSPGRDLYALGKELIGGSQEILMQNYAAIP